MSRHRCTKKLYKAFLQEISMRYSGLALSEVSPIPLLQWTPLSNIKTGYKRDQKMNTIGYRVNKIITKLLGLFKGIA